MSRNDKILVISLAVVMVSIVLVAYAPSAAENGSLTNRAWSVASSTVFIAIISTFIAGFAGTWGAQVLAERNEKRKALLTEIRGTNMALGFAHNITNTYFVFKKQHALELGARYEKQCAELRDFEARRGARTISATEAFSYEADLRTLAAPFSPIQSLERMLSERIMPEGKAIRLLTPLAQCIEGLKNVIDERNAWIAEFKQLPRNSDLQKADMYFGRKSASGHTDERYTNYMQGMSALTDDCIAFSMLLGQALSKYGEARRSEAGRDAPHLATIDWKKAEAAGLIPDMKHYDQWLPL